MTEESGDRNRSLSETSDGEYDPHYAPIITLPEVAVSTNEEDEELVLKLRAKLYRFDRSDESPEWKERGTGEMKVLKHKVNKTVRLVMRRDKTLKVCANHFITPLMELKPMPGMEKAFVYTVPADFSDEMIKSECLAIKFGSADIATQFKKVFLESQEFVRTECKLYNGQAELEMSSDEEDEDDASDPQSDDSEDSQKTPSNTKTADEVTDKLKELSVENGN